MATRDIRLSRLTRLLIGAKGVEENPLFMYRYGKIRSRKFISNIIFFIGPLILVSVALVFLLISGGKGSSLAELVSDYSIDVFIILFGIGIIYSMIRIGIDGVIVNGLSVGKDAEQGLFSDSLSTPLTDREFYEGVCWPGLFRCLEIFEQGAAFYAGILIPVTVAIIWTTLHDLSFLPSILYIAGAYLLIMSYIFLSCYVIVHISSYLALRYNITHAIMWSSLGMAVIILLMFLLALHFIGYFILAVIFYAVKENTVASIMRYREPPSEFEEEGYCADEGERDYYDRMRM